MFYSGGFVSCDALSSCFRSRIQINNVESLSCGVQGCQESEITIINPQNGFTITCGGLYSVN